MAQKMEAQFAGTLLRNIASDSTAIAGGGFRVAEQAFMAVQTFVPMAEKNGKSLEKGANLDEECDRHTSTVCREAGDI